MRITALAGGVGASKLLLGLIEVMRPEELTAVVNVGDDLSMHGLRISPDLDIVTYTLAGLVDPNRGWGYRNETFHLLERLAIYGCPSWFHLGDRDLATHIFRTERLAQGHSLSEVTDEIRTALGVKARILPASDQPVRTEIGTRRGWLPFQEYLVKLRARPVVGKLRFRGALKSKPAPGVLEALREAQGIIICPSNPLISIGPILAVPGIEELLRRRRDSVVAVCPLVGGMSLKGPSDRMMKQLGHDASAVGVSLLYKNICGMMIIDDCDARQARLIERQGMRVKIAPIVMRSGAQKRRVARVAIGCVAEQANRFAGMRSRHSV